MTSEPRLYRVLLIDDHVDTCVILGQLLKGYGYDVRIAYDGREGLEVAESFRPDFVVLDVSLPTLDGYQVTAALRSNPNLTSVLIVAMSGYAAAGDREHSLAAGMNEHFTKPADAKRLLDYFRAHRPAR